MTYDLTPMVRKAAWACPQPTLDSQADKLVCILLKLAKVSSERCTGLKYQDAFDDARVAR